MRKNPEGNLHHKMDLTLSNFICRCDYRDFPPEVTWRAVEVMADSLAVIVAGAQEKEVRNLTNYLLPSNRNTASVLGTGLRSEPLKAAFLNGTAGTFLELDEGNHFSRGHPAIHVIPAALAIAEDMNLGGKNFLTALILGYEIGARIGIACKIRSTMHPHGTWGTVGAAVAVGKLVGYNEQAMKQIINISSSLTLATSRRTMLEGGMVRNTYAGYSGYNGIMAHYLTQSGFTGEKDGISTVFGSVVSEELNKEALLQELGERYEISRNYFKRHACCRYNHATLDAMTEIISTISNKKLLPESIERIDVGTYSLAVQLNDKNPQNTLASKFSIPFAVATFIVNGSTDLESFSMGAINNPTIKQLASKVNVFEKPEFSAMLPARRASEVKVFLTDGSILEAQNLVNKGDSENPYSRDELKGKYFSLLKDIWDSEISKKVYDTVMELESLDDMNCLTGFINPKLG